MSRPRIVFVDPAKREHIKALNDAGYDVTAVDSVRDALRHRPRPDGVIVELLMPEGSDLTALWTPPQRRGRNRAITIIGLAGEAHRDSVVRAGGTFCPYPCPPADLVELMKRTIPLPAA
jgi:CheY-like chemotaxis protein